MRRRAVLLGASAALGGCGFRPLYGPMANGTTVRPELAAIFVGVWAERQGQLLRQALQQRLEGSSDGVAKKYELTGGFTIAAEGIGIQQDSSTSRVRLDARANWVLRKLDLKQAVVTTGNARALDGYNINNQEYFAADLEQSSAFGRLAETVADQIAQDLALYFRKQAQPA